MPARPIIESFMASIFPFPALRPAAHAAAAVAAAFYDVVSINEARGRGRQPAQFSARFQG